MIYVLICLLLSLAGLAGMQVLYMVYLEQMSKEHKKRIRELERHNIDLGDRLQKAEILIEEQEEIIRNAYKELQTEDGEVWAEVIEER